MPDRLPLIWQPDFWNWLQRGGFTCTPYAPAMSYRHPPPTLCWTALHGCSPWIQPQRRELHGSQIGYAPWCITRGTPDDPHPDGHTDTLGTVDPRMNPGGTPGGRRVLALQQAHPLARRSSTPYCLLQQQVAYQDTRAHRKSHSGQGARRVRTPKARIPGQQRVQSAHW